MAKNNVWITIGRGADILSLLSTKIVSLGISCLMGATAQNVPTVSTLGFFGMGMVTILCLFILTLTAWLGERSAKTKKFATRISGHGKWQKILRWIFGIGLIGAAIYQIELRPTLPLGISKAEVLHPIATYSEMNKPVIRGRTVIVTALPRKRGSTLLIADKRFEQCQIIGPAALLIVPPFEMSQCQVAGVDREGVFFETKSKVGGTGMIGLGNCKFHQCSFLGISFAGNTEIISKLRVGL